MRFTVQYHELVISKDIPALSKKDRIRIQLAIEEKLTNRPEMFGKPLRRSLRGYRRLRVGDYRIIYRMEQTIVKIFVIDHRSVVYEQYSKRFP